MGGAAAHRGEELLLKDRSSQTGTGVAGKDWQE